MYILVDYENVGAAGLKGAEFLCKDDSITIFYGPSCVKIERQYIEPIKENCLDFDIVKLHEVRKNALDFYIAVKVGQIAETTNNAKILIVSKDHGFLAIKDYCQNYTSLKNRLFIKESIETGIVAMDGSTVRKKAILNKHERTSIEAEYALYKKKQKTEKNIMEACRGTEFEASASSIAKIADAAITPRDRYLSSLRMFGINDGTKVYRLIKGAV